LAAKSALKTNESEIAQNGFLKEPITKGIDSFTVVKKLGEGSFSQVFKVIEKETNSLYALKVMEKEGLKELQVIDRLASELKIQSFSNHVNIVKLYG
jgi:serine/threonine protein kinase